MSAPAVWLFTGSDRKRAQYRYLLAELGLALRAPAITVGVHEPQIEGVGAGPEQALVTEPLRQVADEVQLLDAYPFVIDDTMLFVEHVNGDYDARPVLPGPDTKRWWAALGAAGLVRLLAGSTARRARYVCQLGVLTGPGAQPRVYRVELDGAIAPGVGGDPPGGDDFPRTNGYFFHSVFVPVGAGCTLAEMDAPEFARHDYRRRGLHLAAPLLQDAVRGGAAAADGGA